MGVKKITTRKILPKPTMEIGWYIRGERIDLYNLSEDFSYNSDMEFMFFDGEKKNHLWFAQEELPYCCGIIEFGDLQTRGNIPQKNFNELMALKLHSLSGVTVMINTINSEGLKHFEDLLTKCPYFVLVKEFINPNSKNTIKMWVSNN